MNEHEAFMQGAKSGYSAGKGRAGSYVIGEEIELAWDAVADQSFVRGFSDAKLDLAWERGYQHGYRLAAEGSPLMTASSL